MPRSPDPRRPDWPRTSWRGWQRAGSWSGCGEAATCPSGASQPTRRPATGSWWRRPGRCSARAALSHVSGAVLHGLPVWAEHLARVHLTRTVGRGKRRGNVHAHVAPLLEGEVVEVVGLAVTRLARWGWQRTRSSSA